MAKKMVLFASLVWLLSACAGRPEAKEYTTRHIDQPYVLPVGMKSVSFGAAYWELDYGSTGTTADYGLPLVNFSLGSGEYQTRYALPLGVQYGIRTSQQWDLNFRYLYTGIYSDDLRRNGHHASVLATNYW